MTEAAAKRKRPRWVKWLIEAVLVVVVVLGVSFWQGRSLLSRGGAAPPFALETFEGQPLSLADLRGQKTLLVFWAPWCGVCGAESDNVTRVGEWLGERVKVVSVVLSYRDRESVERFMKDQAVDYPVLMGNDQTAADYQVSMYPTLYVLDADGRIEHTAAGYTTTLGMLWRVML